MQDYAVVQIAHRQYMVEPGKTYEVDKFAGNVGDKVELEVLALAKGGKLTIGQPLIEKVAAKVEILSQEKGEKVSTFVYKAKSRYHKRHGFRKQVTKFKVLEIK